MPVRPPSGCTSTPTRCATGYVGPRRSADSTCTIRKSGCSPNCSCSGSSSPHTAREGYGEVVPSVGFEPTLVTLLGGLPLPLGYEGMTIIPAGVIAHFAAAWPVQATKRPASRKEAPLLLCPGSAHPTQETSVLHLGLAGRLEGLTWLGHVRKRREITAQEKAQRPVRQHPQLAVEGRHGHQVVGAVCVPGRATGQLDLPEQLCGALAHTQTGDRTEVLVPVGGQLPTTQGGDDVVRQDRCHTHRVLGVGRVEALPAVRHLGVVTTGEGVLHAVDGQVLAGVDVALGPQGQVTGGH